ncbi:MAG: hypothetical protein ACYCO9_22775 [Streptosporangiaceae bacterium]
MHLLNRRSLGRGRGVPGLGRRSLAVAVRPAVILTLAALALVAGVGRPALASQAPGGTGGCYRAGLVWTCRYLSSTPGTGSTRTARYTCVFSQAPVGILQRTGTGPAQRGDQWDIIRCPGPRRGPADGELVEVSVGSGRLLVDPADLLQVALRRLAVPSLRPATAPPRGRDGLVGLPEWFWIPRGQWRPISVTVTAGPVWAVAVATPVRLTYLPGGGLAATSCPGPGTPYRPGIPAAAQQTRCSYTYPMPSTGQPSLAYRAEVIVGWRITWTDSTGAGGLVTPDYAVGSPLPIRVAQAEALVVEP